MPSARRIILDNILESLPVGLWVIDAKGRVAAISPSAGGLLGVDPGAVKGRPWRELLREVPENAAFNAVVAASVDEGRSARHRLVDYQAPDGREFRLSLTSSRLEDSGRPVGVVVLLDDVTELSRSRERETRVLQEKNRLQYDMIESLNNLALSVAHHIRNPVTAVGGFSLRLLGFLKEHRLSTDYAEIIFQEAKRLEDIVGAVVRLSSLPRLRLETVRLGPLLKSVVARVSKDASRMHRQVRWTVGVADHAVEADPHLLTAALTEMLRNAVEFNNRTEIGVTVSGRVEGDAYVIEVTDDGPGIAPANRPFVFDPFFSTKAHGAGIGLTIARKVAVELNGRIGLRTGPGGGTTVTLGLGAHPDNGLYFERTAPLGLDARELLAKAAMTGADIRGLSTIDAVRAIQVAEGYEPCFGNGKRDVCDREDCSFRGDCLRVGRVEDPCKYIFHAQDGKDGGLPDGTSAASRGERGET